MAFHAPYLGVREVVASAFVAVTVHSLYWISNSHAIVGVGG